MARPNINRDCVALFIRIKEKHRDALRNEAERRGVSLNALCCEVLGDYVAVADSKSTPAALPSSSNSLP